MATYSLFFMPEKMHDSVLLYYYIIVYVKPPMQIYLKIPTEFHVRVTAIVIIHVQTQSSLCKLAVTPSGTHTTHTHTLHSLPHTSPLPAV